MWRCTQTTRRAGRSGREAAILGASFLVDARGTLLGFDERMELLTGWPALEVVGRSKDCLRPRELASSAQAGEQPLYEGSLSEARDGEVRELRLHCRDGSVLEVEAAVRALQGSGKRFWVSVVRVLAHSQPAAAAGGVGCDGLTGLADLERFRQSLAQCLAEARAHGRTLALLLLDVDHLRHVNDRFGREAGDQVLKRIAGILRASVEDERGLARVGEDEFALWLPGAGRGEARQVAARVRSTVERFRFFGLEGPPAGTVTLSIGAASYPSDADSEVDLLRRAQDALEQARALGRNRVWCYTRRPRVPLEVPVYFDGAEELLVGFTRDLSPSGLFVRTPLPIETGMRCALTFPLPDHPQKVHVVGRVVRTVPPDAAQERIAGMGIEFERFGPEDRRAIELYLHRNEARVSRLEEGTCSVA